MVTANYSEENAIEILQEFNKIGWNLYRHLNCMTPENNIRQNLASRLERDAHYTLLPAVKDATDPEKVFAALETVAVELDRKIPKIEIGGQTYEMFGITLKESSVKLHSPDGDVVEYEAFKNSIKSFVNAKKILGSE